jgi:hypothetical protein
LVMGVYGPVARTFGVDLKNERFQERRVVIGSDGSQLPRRSIGSPIYVCFLPSLQVFCGAANVS